MRTAGWREAVEEEGGSWQAEGRAHRRLARGGGGGGELARGLTATAGW